MSHRKIIGSEFETPRSRALLQLKAQGIGARKLARALGVSGNVASAILRGRLVPGFSYRERLRGRFGIGCELADWAAPPLGSALPRQDLEYLRIRERVISLSNQLSEITDPLERVPLMQRRANCIQRAWLVCDIFEQMRLEKIVREEGGPKFPAVQELLERGILPSEFAKRLAVPERSAGRIYAGHLPSLDVRMRAARVFGLTLDAWRRPRVLATVSAPIW